MQFKRITSDMEKENKSSGEISRKIKLEKSRSARSGKPIHTYTPESHENLMKQFSRVSFKQDEVKALKKEINQLKVELRKANVELKLKEDRISVLENALMQQPNHAHLTSNENSDFEMDTKDEEPEVPNYGSPRGTLSRHFSEVVRRHHETLEQKDRQIRELQALVEQCRAQQKAMPEHQIQSHDLSLDSTLKNQNYVDTKKNTEEINVRRKNHENQVDGFRAIFPKPGDNITVIETPTTSAVNCIIKPAVKFDIHKIGNYFLKKLEFEQQMDVLYWEIEQGRYQMLQDDSECDSDQKHANKEEFEMFKKTREQLLKDLAEMRAAYDKNEIERLLTYRDRSDDNHHATNERSAKSVTWSKDVSTHT